MHLFLSLVDFLHCVTVGVCLLREVLEIRPAFVLIGSSKRK